MEQVESSMATPSVSSHDASGASEIAMDCQLVLTTLSGAIVEMSASVAQYDRFEEFEERVVDYLASASDLGVFGCALDFIHPTEQTYLDDPIWETLQNNMQYTIVFRDCFEALSTKEAFAGCPYRDIPKAVKVPTNQSGIIPSSAFLAVPRLRRVSVEAGVRAVGAQAWQSCRRLRIVKMPSSVVRIEENTFRGCHLLI